MRRLTTKEFIEKAKLVHGDRYSYNNVVYNKSNIHVAITCLKHGDFLQKPNVHLCGSGCRKCKTDIHKQKFTHSKDKFIEKARRVHGNKYDYSLVKYINSHNDVKIICKEHGVFEQKPLSHLRGHECIKCSLIKSGLKNRLTTNEFIEKSKKIHGNKHDYSITEYVKQTIKVKIICKHHGVFRQLPNGHLSGSGCMKCYGNLKNQKETIEDFKNYHGNIYDYSLVDYKNSNTKVNIICEKHGVFSQTPTAHKNGQGCPKCSLNYKRDNPIGWNVSSWEEAALKSKNFDSFKVYIIECYNDEERFYKIGRTFKSVVKRFENKIPYNYKIIKQFVFETAEEAFEKERQLKINNKCYSYTPLIKFGGITECFIDIKTIN